MSVGNNALRHVITLKYVTTVKNHSLRNVTEMYFLLLRLIALWTESWNVNVYDMWHLSNTSKL